MVGHGRNCSVDDCWVHKQGWFTSRLVDVNKQGWFAPRPSNTSIEEPTCCQPKKDSEYSCLTDTDSLDDNVIKIKIEEANKLIDRVKRTLEKMKCTKDKQVKPKSPCCAIKSSSTDIEETIKNLQMETEVLLSGRKHNEPALKREPRRPQTRRCDRPTPVCTPITDCLPTTARSLTPNRSPIPTRSPITNRSPITSRSPITKRVSKRELTLRKARSPKQENSPRSARSPKTNRSPRMEHSAKTICLPKTKCSTKPECSPKTDRSPRSEHLTKTICTTTRVQNVSQKTQCSPRLDLPAKISCLPRMNFSPRTVRSPKLSSLPKSTRGPKGKFIKKKSDSEEETSDTTTRSPNDTFIRKSDERKCESCYDSSDESVIETLPKAISISRPCFEKDLENARKRSAEAIVGLDCNKVNFERPMTRRNEGEDDITDEARLDKFRNCPDIDQIPVSSSLEELQAKLQTISESTESSFESPRNKKSCEHVCGHLITEIKSFGCNTEKKHTVAKETQVDCVKDYVTNGCYCVSESKHVQTTCCKSPILTNANYGVISIPSIPKELKTAVVAVHGVPPHHSKCTADILPIVQVTPSGGCIRCKKTLGEEHMQNISIPSNHKKQRELTIKLLPPIIINPGMMVTQVLNFYITPHGKTQNLLENTANVKYQEILRSSHEDMDKGQKVVCLKVTSRDLDSPSSGRSRGSENHNFKTKPVNSKFFIHLKNQLSKNLDLAEEPSSSDLDEEEQQKLFVYKSYNIYDNPNTHDPAPLDTKSSDKISKIDLNFYRTFINPEGLYMDKEVPFGSKTALRLGLHNKAVQCNSDSLLNAMGVSKKEDIPVTDGHQITTESHQDSKKLVFQYENNDPVSTDTLGHATVLEDFRKISEDSTADESRIINSFEYTQEEDEVVKPINLEVPSTKIFFERNNLEHIDVSRNELGEINFGEKSPSWDDAVEEKHPLDRKHAKESTMKTHFVSSEQKRPIGEYASTRILVKEKITPAQRHEDQESTVTLQNVKLAIPKPQASMAHSLIPINKSKPFSPQQSEESSITPSEITVTISYSQSSEEGSSHNQKVNKSPQESLESEIKSVDIDDSLTIDESIIPDLITSNELEGTNANQSTESNKNKPIKCLKPVDKQIIQKLQHKFREVDTESSQPIMTVNKNETDDKAETVTSFITGLTKLAAKSVDEINLTDNKNSNQFDVNCHLIDMDLDSRINLYEQHLILASNGRYKDEEDLFAENPVALLTQSKRRRRSPIADKEIKDDELPSSKLNTCQNDRLGNYLPDLTNSDTVTTTSLSETEKKCRPSHSTEEINSNKRLGPKVHHRLRKVLKRSHLTNFPSTQKVDTANVRSIIRRSTYTNTSLSPQPDILSYGNVMGSKCDDRRYTIVSERSRSRFPRLCSSSVYHNSHLTKFDLSDPKVTIEKRRNYFNNWVTYFVKTQEINASSASSCAHNK